MGTLVGIFWGVFSVVLGYAVTNSWQAWVIIIAGVLSFHLGKLERN